MLGGILSTNRYVKCKMSSLMGNYNRNERFDTNYSGRQLLEGLESPDLKYKMWCVKYKWPA